MSAPGKDSARAPRLRVDPAWLLASPLLVWTLSEVVLPTQLPGRSPVGYWVMGLIGTLLFAASLLAYDGLESRAGAGKRSPLDELVMGGIGLALGLSGSVVAGALGWSIARSGGSVLAAATCFYLATVSLAIAALELLPGVSPNGGSLLHAAIWYRTGDASRATYVSFAVSKGVGLLIVLTGLWQLAGRHFLAGLWLLTIGGMFLSAQWRAASPDRGNAHGLRRISTATAFGRRR